MKYRKSEAKEASRASFHGVWAAITTPFNADLSVDELGLRQNMRRLTNDLKIAGVFCTGVMGEFWSLTKEERKRVVEIVVEEARGKCGVIAHTAHHSVHETIDLTLHAQEVGADFAILINPYYPPVTEPMAYEWWRQVANAVDIGIWMFETGKDGYAQYGFSPELTDKIADLENVCGIKLVRSWSQMDHVLAVKRLSGEKIVISNPSESDWLKLIRDHQQQVHMSSPFPYAFQTPGWTPIRDYTQLAFDGKFDEAEQLSNSLQPLRDLYTKWVAARWASERVIGMAYLKVWTELLGMAGGPSRAPLLQVPDEEREAMKADLEKAGLLAKVAAAV